MSGGLANAVLAGPPIAGWPFSRAGDFEGALTIVAVARSGSAKRLLKALLGSAMLHLLVLLGVGLPMPGQTLAVRTVDVLTVRLDPGTVASAIDAAREQAATATDTRGKSSVSETQKNHDFSANSTADRAGLADRPLMFALRTGGDRNYYASDELDEVPAPVNDVLLRYPQSAFANGIAGEVRLRLLINEAGQVDEAIVTVAEPAGVFDQAALDAARQLRFSPAVRAGRVVKSTKDIAILFDPTSNPIH